MSPTKGKPKASKKADRVKRVKRGEARGHAKRLKSKLIDKLEIESEDGGHCYCFDEMLSELGSEATLDIFRVTVDNDPDNPGTDVSEHIEITAEYVE